MTVDDWIERGLTDSQAKRLVKNDEYWKERFTALESRQNQQGQEYYQSLQNVYQRATNEMERDISKWYMRLANNNGISLSEAKKILSTSELKEFKWNVAEYIKAGKENTIDQRWMRELENASTKVHISRLEALKMQLQQHVEVLYGGQMDGLSKMLENTYTDAYYRTGFEIAKGTGIGSNLHKLDTRQINQVIGKPWAADGANFSDRIWSNRTKLVNNLNAELTQGIILGSDPQKAINQLAKTMNVSKGQAGTLVMTESAAISSRATQDCFKELGVEQFEILATLDNLTSKICQSLDGEVFDMKDYEVGSTAPPFHPNCRSTTVPFFDDEFTIGEERAARDPVTGKTTYVPSNMKYGEWKEKYVTNSSNNIIRDDIKNNDDYYQQYFDKYTSKVTDNNWNQYLNDFSNENSVVLNSIHTDLNKHMFQYKTEKLAIMSVSRNKLLNVDIGDRINRTQLSRETIKHLKKSPVNDIILSHVHPSKDSFSYDDMEQLAIFKSIRTLTIENISGKKCILERGNFQCGVFSKSKLRSVYSKVDQLMLTKYKELSSGDLNTISTVLEQYTGERNSLIAKELGMIYKEVD